MGWPAPSWGHTAGATWSRDTTVSRTSSASLKLQVPASGGNMFTYSNPKTRVGKGTYTYGAWIRTDGVTGTGAHIDPLFFDADARLVGSDHRKFAATGTHDWEQVSLDLPTPAGATQVELHLRLSGPGTAWFDDLTVTPPKSADTAEQPVRRAAYVDMLKSSRDYWRQHFPHYTNQSQICAIGIYQANRGLRLLDPDLALPEEKARDYMYQSLGMKPYLGREDADGNPTRPLGETYHQVTKAGLTRELGYVGSYGEVIDWLVMMYESVTRGRDTREAPELREQMIRITKARGRFRVVDVDETGGKVSRIETVIGWRNEVYPGEVALRLPHRLGLPPADGGGGLQGPRHRRLDPGDGGRRAVLPAAGPAREEQLDPRRSRRAPPRLPRLGRIPVPRLPPGPDPDCPGPARLRLRRRGERLPRRQERQGTAVRRPVLAVPPGRQQLRPHPPPHRRRPALRDGPSALRRHHRRDLHAASTKGPAASGVRARRRTRPSLRIRSVHRLRPRGGSGRTAAAGSAGVTGRWRPRSTEDPAR
nr:hypothetical protein [Streptomyces dysideae]